MTQARTSKRHNPFVASADHATGTTDRSWLIYSWPDFHVVLSPYLEAKAKPALELSYLGDSLLLGKTSKSTAELCPPHKTALLRRQSTMFTIVFHRRTITETGLSLVNTSN